MIDELFAKFARLCDETKKRPRVFIATQTFPPRIGGMENVMEALAEKFSQIGHNVTVLPNRAYRTPSAFRVISLGMIRPLRIIAKRLVLKLMLRNEDVVICDSWKPINVITRRFKERLVVLAHGQEYLKGDKHFKKIQSALTRASAVIASSDFTAGLIRQRYEIAPSKLKVIPPTYMLEADGAPQIATKDNTMPVHLISLCRLDKRKGLMQTLHALHGIGTTAQKWHWDIIGNGPEAEVLKEEVARLGLSDKIKFHYNVGDAEKAEKLSAADLFVMPSYQVGGSVEGFGISYIEAAQYGLPAIAGIAGGSASAVKDGETGWCIDTTDKGQIEAALVEAINSSEERDRRGQAAFMRYQNEFLGDRVFDDFIAHATATAGA